MIGMSIKCIALDMDRTTLNAQGKLSKENREALIYAMQKGVHVCIASGRAFSALPEESVKDEEMLRGAGIGIYRIL